MSISLDYFQYLPRDQDGWGTQRLIFGSVLTAVQAPNGAGKTPVMKGIAAALGHDVQLPPEVREHCLYAELGIVVDGEPIVLTRTLEDSFELRASGSDWDIDFVSETQFGTWFAERLSGGSPELTSKSRERTQLYSSILLPALWVDQDHGWTADYWVPAKRNFVLDQRQEVIRFLLGLPQRHPFRSATAFDDAKRRLAQAEKSLDLQRFVMDRIGRGLTYSIAEEERLVDAKAYLEGELSLNREAVEAVRASTATFDRQLDEIEAERIRLRNEKDELLRRKKQIDQVLSELSGEEDILEANSTATDLMRQICGRAECSMFAGSERSFGRSLLFLRDQMKDLRFTGQNVDDSMRRVDALITELGYEGDRVRNIRAAVVNSSGHVDILSKLDNLTSRLVTTSLELARFQQVRMERERFETLLDRREQEALAVAETRPTGGTRMSTNDARTMLGDSIQRWLNVLGTKNTKSARFDEDFVLHINDQVFSESSHQSGSTRTRIILAFHAALLDVSLQRGGNHPGFLIFDAPKQHELDQGDFDAYVENLQLIAATYGSRVQIVFSAADVKTQLQVGDSLWLPGFFIGGESRFLGRV